MEELKYTFFGVRGSYPVSDKKFIKYGGNTTSILFESGNDIFIIDAGTGIINIGNYLKKRNKEIKKIDIFLTHLHSDHIIGFPFFNPFYDNGTQINIYCFKHKKTSVKNTIFSLFNQPLSPISKKGINAGLKFIEVESKGILPVKINQYTSVDGIKEENHPKSGVLIYKVNFHDKKLVFATDVETPDGFSGKYIDFIKDADVFIHDAQYTSADYYDEDNPKAGYGHNTVDMALSNAESLNVKKLFLFHHSPEYSDRKLENILKYSKKRFKNSFLAQELKTNIVRR